MLKVADEDGERKCLPAKDCSHDDTFDQSRLSKASPGHGIHEYLSSTPLEVALPSLLHTLTQITLNGLPKGYDGRRLLKTAHEIVHAPK